MSFMPREVTADPMSRMQQFMDARASVAALPPSVQAFMSADTGRQDASRADTYDDEVIVVGPEAEKLMSGLVNNDRYSNFAQMGEVARGTDPGSVKEEKERRDRAAIDYIRRQQEMHAQLVANVERYTREYEAAQLEVATAQRELDEALKQRAAANERFEQSSVKVEDAMARSREEGEQAKGLSVTIDGKTITMDSNRNYVDQDGNRVAPEVVAQSQDPAAIEMEEARKAAEAARSAAYQQYGASRLAGREYENVDEAETQLEEKIETAQELEARLKAEQEALERSERELERTSSLEGDAVDSEDNNGTAPPVAVASMTPEQKQADRAVTDTAGFVEAQRIEVASVKLGGDFRSAALGESAAPQTPEITQNNDMAAEANRVAALRNNSGMSNALA